MGSQSGNRICHGQEARESVTPISGDILSGTDQPWAHVLTEQGVFYLELLEVTPLSCLQIVIEEHLFLLIYSLLLRHCIRFFSYIILNPSNNAIK